MDLESHQRLQIAPCDFSVDAEHGDFDEVGGGALQGCVDGGALGESALVGVAGLDVGDGADAAEGCPDGLVAADNFKGALDEGADAGVALVVALNVFLGGALVDVELSREAERRDAVDDAEVHSFRPGTNFFGHRRRVDFEDLGGGEGVDVFAGAVGVEQEGVLREVGHEAEFDLRVVGGHQQVALGGDEAGADFTANGGTDGDVLQVGIDRAETARGGANLVECGVDAAVGVGEDRERVEVGALELLELAVFEDPGRDFVLGGKAFENVLGSGDDLALAVLDRLGKTHLVEENVA